MLTFQLPNLKLKKKKNSFEEKCYVQRSLNLASQWIVTNTRTVYGIISNTNQKITKVQKVLSVFRKLFVDVMMYSKLLKIQKKANRPTVVAVLRAVNSVTREAALSTIFVESQMSTWLCNAFKRYSELKRQLGWNRFYEIRTGQGRQSQKTATCHKQFVKMTI